MLCFLSFRRRRRAVALVSVRTAGVEHRARGSTPAPLGRRGGTVSAARFLVRLSHAHPATRPPTPTTPPPHPPRTRAPKRPTSEISGRDALRRIGCPPAHPPGRAPSSSSTATGWDDTGGGRGGEVGGIGAGPRRGGAVWPGRRARPGEGFRPTLCPRTVLTHPSPNHRGARGAGGGARGRFAVPKQKSSLPATPQRDRTHPTHPFSHRASNWTTRLVRFLYRMR